MKCLVTGACRNFSAAASRCAHMMARGLAANKCIVDVVIGGLGDYYGKDHEGCTDYNFTCLAKSDGKPGSVLKHFRMMYNGIIENRWDLIVFYSVGVQFVPLVTLARRHGIKIVYVQGDHYVTLPGMSIKDRFKLSIINWIDRYLSTHADLNALAGTSVLAEYFLEQAPKTPIYVSYPPIDIDLFSLGDGDCFRKRYSLGNKLIIGYCGGVGSLEGVEVLIRAMRLVANIVPEAHLVIAGRLGDYDHALSQQIDYPKLVAELDITDRVTFTGFIDQTEVRGLLSASTLLTMPKLEHRRNAVAAPIKLSEYFASGTPVIATTVGDIGTRFHNGSELLFCIPGDSKDLSEKIVYLLNHPDVAQQIASNGQVYARKNFDYRTWGVDILNLLQK